MNINIGIYYIKLIPTQQMYVGQSRDIRRRLTDHLTELLRGLHSNSTLQVLWNAYSYTDFELGILENCSLEDLNAREEFYINLVPTELLINKVTTQGANYLWSGTPEEKLLFRELVLKGIERQKKEKLLSEEEKLERAKVRGDETRKICKHLVPNKGKHLAPNSSLNHSRHAAATWEIEDSHGNRHIIKNLTEFCRQHNLRVKALIETAPGKLVNRGKGQYRPRVTHKGFKVVKKF